MKRLIAIITAACLTAAMAGCAQKKPEATEPASTAAATETAAPATEAPTEAAETVMIYAEYMAADIDTPVTVVTYVQDHQSWWDGQITCYTQDRDGAYFIYNMACSEEDSKRLTPGTKIKVSGYKSEWSGEIEITDAEFEFVDDGDTYIAAPVDLTDCIGSDELFDHMNEYVAFKGVTVESEPLYKWDGSGSDGDDLYFDISYNGVQATFTVESYLRGAGTEVYENVKKLKIGDVVDLKGFLYWYEGPNPHITVCEAARNTETSIDLSILYEQDDSMINTYTVMAVNPEAPFADADGKPVKDVEINKEGAEALINWMLSEEGEKAAADYGYEDYGEYLFYIKSDAPVSKAEIPAATEKTKTVRMSTTTSVNDSGLLGYLLPIFEKKYGYDVEVFSAGTGKAIANAKMGNADVILVHAKAQEEKFVEEGFSYVIDGMTSERNSFMYNYFVLCGPSDDLANVKECADVKAAFAAIAEGGYLFVSRGDNSGTHTKEISLWPEELKITVEADSIKNYGWYTYSNAGMGVCLSMAEQMGAYILSDKATYLTFRKNDGDI